MSTSAFRASCCEHGEGPSLERVQGRHTLFQEQLLGRTGAFVDRAEALPDILKKRSGKVRRGLEFLRKRREQGEKNLLIHRRAGDQELKEAVLVGGHSFSSTAVCLAYLDFAAAEARPPP